MIGLIFILISINTTFAFSCWFNTEPNTQINDILVYDENKIFKDTLSNLNNQVTQGDFLRITFNPTTDNQNNINSQMLSILDENSIVDVDFREYNNLDNSLTGGFEYTYNNKNFEYLGINYNAKSYLKPINYNDGNPQTMFNLAVKLNKVGFNKIVYESVDSCGENNIKHLDIQVNPQSNPTSFTCNGVLNIPTNSGDIDVVLNNGCNNIEFTGTTSGATPLNVYIFKGTINNNNEILINSTQTNNGGINLNFFDSYENKFNILQSNSLQKLFDIYGNYKNLDIKGSRAQEFYNLGSNSILNMTGSPFSNIIYQSSGTLIGNSFTLRESKFQNLNIVLNSNSINLDSGANNNIIIINESSNLNTNSRISIAGYSFDSFNEYYLNTFINLPPKLSFSNEFGVDYLLIYLNKFQFNEIFDKNNFIDGMNSMLLEDTYLFKNINGVNVGNMWLDHNENDLFTCNGSLNDLTYQGTSYKVCDELVELQCFFGMFGEICIYDYIIVTDESQGGFEPIVENKKPTAIIEINPLEQIVGNNMNWDISSSYDIDGTILNKKVWIDNVLFENQNTGTITSNEPKIINFKVEVTDNQGLKDTIYRQGVFKDTPQNCLGSPIPYAEIETTNLGNNQYRFKAINVFNGGESLDNLQYYWTINYNTIQGQEIISSVDFNQTIYLNVFNGCNEDIFYDFVTSTNQIDLTTQPIVSLNCDVSSNTPPSVLSCEVDFDLRGYNLNNIIWSSNGNIENSYNNQTSFSKIYNDLGQHTISVTIYSNAPNQKTEYYNFALSNLIIGENDIFGCMDNLATNYNPNATIDNGTCVYDDTENFTGSINLITGDIGETTDNIVGFFKDITNGISSIAIPLSILVISVLIILGVFAIIS